VQHHTFLISQPYKKVSSARSGGFSLREIAPLTPLERDCRHAPSGHKFKDDRELETVATRWPIIKVTDFHQQSIE